MKQAFQRLVDRMTMIGEVPAQQVRDGYDLICMKASTIYGWPERILVAFGKSNYLDSARRQPDRFRKILDVRTAGLDTTVDTVRNELRRPITLRCANPSMVPVIGRAIGELAAGDRFTTIGSLAEMALVPRNLVVGPPARDGARVTAQGAGFASIAAVALQWALLATPKTGSRIAESELGLVGLLTLQFLRMPSCAVGRTDRDKPQFAFARALGGTTVSRDAAPVVMAAPFADRLGVDVVPVTASSHSVNPARRAHLFRNVRVIMQRGSNRFEVHPVGLRGKNSSSWMVSLHPAPRRTNLVGGAHRSTVGVRLLECGAEPRRFSASSCRRQQVFVVCPHFRAFSTSMGGKNRVPSQLLGSGETV